MNTQEIIKEWLKNYGLDGIKVKNAAIIDSAESFNDKIIRKYTIPKNGNDKHKYVFRGLSNATQKYSTLTRQLYQDSIEYDESNATFCDKFNKELLYIRKFEENDAFELPGIKTVTDLIAAAQHYSVRTRFIDWTTSPLVATLFALYENKGITKKENREKPYYYLLLVVDAKNHIMAEALPTPNYSNAGILGAPEKSYITYGLMLKELMDLYFELTELKSGKKHSAYGKNRFQNNARNYFERLFRETNTLTVMNINSNLSDKVGKYKEKFYKGKMFFLETNFANTRIVNQRGLFQIAIDPNKKYIDNCFKYINCYFISIKARESIIKLCKNLGFNYYGLMPDSQSIAQAVNREVD